VRKENNKTVTSCADVSEKWEQEGGPTEVFHTISVNQKADVATTNGFIPEERLYVSISSLINYSPQLKANTHSLPYATCRI